MRWTVVVMITACGSSSSTPTPAPIPEAKVAPAPPSPPRKTGVERKLYPISIDASSFLEADTRPYVQYHPNFASDDDPKTAWNEGATGNGPGEWLRFKLTPQIGVSHVRLRVLNGFQFDDNIWRSNARAKTVEVTLLPGGKPRKLTLADGKDWQELGFDTETPALDTIELKIVDVYPGAKFADLAISEVEIYVTSETPEKPDIEKQHLADRLDWKAHQKSLAGLVVQPPDLVVGDETEMPAAAKPFVAPSGSGASGHELEVSLKGNDISPSVIANCFDADSYDAGCLGQLLTTNGLKARVTRDEPAEACHPTMLGSPDPNGAVEQISIGVCIDLPTRGGPEYHWGTIDLVYDEDGRLRAAISKEHTLYYEWSPGNKPAIIGGVWKSWGIVPALVPRKK